MNNPHRSHYAYTIDRLDETGVIVERLAGVEDFQVAEATWRAATRRWPKEHIILRNRERVIHDSRRPPLVR
jgi:hypothetical protein